VRSSACVDCGRDTMPAGLSAEVEYYMVRNELWAAADMGHPRGGMLCVGCIEGRLGRELVPADFTNVVANNYSPHNSERLSRRQGWLVPDGKGGLRRRRLLGYWRKVQRAPRAAKRWVKWRIGGGRRSARATWQSEGSDN
jgi:hypothetical protein